MKVGRLFFAAMLVFVLIVLPLMVYTVGYFAASSAEDVSQRNASSNIEVRGEG